jgi:arylsulfatase A
MPHNVTRRGFLRSLNVATVSYSLSLVPFPRGATTGAADRDKPNIVYILVDDLGYGDINLGLENAGAFANPNIKTPHLAKLAADSLVFRHHYAASPVCSPSRAGLLTGRTPTRCNINQYINDKKENDRYFLRGDEITIPELLKTRGYQTAVFGKWHLNGADWERPQSWRGWTGSFPKQQGFDHGIVCKEDPHFTRRLNVNTQKHPGDYFTVEGEPLGAIKGYSSDIITERAVAWMRNTRDRTRPFFVYLPYDAVHIRVAAADKYEQMYNTGDARKDAYYANVAHVDAAIGRLIEALDELGLRENTLVFFSSDNGPDVLRCWDATYFCYGTSYPLAGQKYQLYEGGIRVPGMVRWPGRIRPGISDEPNSTLDVLPTLCELAGATLPTDRAIDGASILGHLLDGKPVERETPLYWQYEYPREYEVIGEGYERRLNGEKVKRERHRPHVGIREGDYVLLGCHDRRFTPPDEFRLYNVVQDPEQQNELSHREHRRFETMKSKLIAMYRRVNADRKRTEAAIQARAR